jgi:hypothetical protein
MAKIKGWSGTYIPGENLLNKGETDEEHGGFMD